MFSAIRKQTEGSLIKLARFNGFLAHIFICVRCLPAWLWKNYAKEGNCDVCQRVIRALRPITPSMEFHVACWVVAAGAVGKSILRQPGVILKNVEVPSSGRSQWTVDLTSSETPSTIEKTRGVERLGLTPSRVSKSNPSCSFNFIFEQLLAIFLMFCLLAAIYQTLAFPIDPRRLGVEHSNKSLRVECQTFHNEPSRVKMSECQKVSVSLSPWLLSSGYRRPKRLTNKTFK